MSAATGPRQSVHISQCQSMAVSTPPAGKVPRPAAGTTNRRWGKFNADPHCWFRGIVATLIIPPSGRDIDSRADGTSASAAILSPANTCAGSSAPGQPEAADTDPNPRRQRRDGGDQERLRHGGTAVLLHGSDLRRPPSMCDDFVGKEAAARRLRKAFPAAQSSTTGRVAPPAPHSGCAAPHRNRSVVTTSRQVDAESADPARNPRSPRRDVSGSAVQ